MYLVNFFLDQPVRDDDSRIFVAMTWTLEQCNLIRIDFASASEFCQENHCVGCKA